jgi:phospholipid/cholesterol/gamma-HCH transport system substrate-binding protein
MDERIAQFRVGVMVLATLIITGILMLLFGKRPDFGKSTYTLKAVFPDAPGVSADTPVRKSGVLIGRVTGVTLEDDGTVSVTMDIDGNRKLRKNDVLFINESILGDATLEFQRIDNEGLPDTPLDVQSQTPLRGRVRPNAMRVVSDLEGKLAELIDAMTVASKDVSKLSNQFSRVMGSDNDRLARVMDKTEQTLDSVRRAADSANDVLGDKELNASLKQALNDVPAAMADAREAMAAMKQTMSLADKNLQNLEGFTEALGRDGGQIIVKFDRSATRLERMLSNLTEFTEVLKGDEGTIGRLLRDPELYDNINQAACNIRQLTEEMRPIVKDVRVFTDKIARHPETLGVGGAVRRSPGTK